MASRAAGAARRPRPAALAALGAVRRRCSRTLLVAVVGVGVIALVVELAGVDTVGDDTPPGVTIGGTYVQDLALIGASLLLARLLDRP